MSTVEAESLFGSDVAQAVGSLITPTHHRRARWEAMRDLAGSRQYADAVSLELLPTETHEEIEATAQGYWPGPNMHRRMADWMMRNKDHATVIITVAQPDQLPDFWRHVDLLTAARAVSGAEASPPPVNRLIA
jgi:hypothetical protein